MEKMKYNQPTTDVMTLSTQRMMQDLLVSVNGGSGDQHPTAGAPRRGDIID